MQAQPCYHESEQAAQCEPQEAERHEKPRPAEERSLGRVHGHEAFLRKEHVVNELGLGKARQTGHHLSDNEVVQCMARQVLASEPSAATQAGGAAKNEANNGRSRYQIAITLCERCGQAGQEGGGQSVPISESALETAQCDAQVLHTRPHVGVSTPPHTRKSAAGHEGRRAKQTVPPATRRAVFRRHRNRCGVPGCRHRAFLDVHHLDRRAEGGRHDPERLIVLCGAHHRAEHEGTLQIDGTASTGFHFRHADGRPYGSQVHPQTAGIYASAFSALKHMGFKEGQARKALESARPHVGQGSTLEYVVREALRHVPIREAIAEYKAA
jgi:hypothetical protein